MCREGGFHEGLDSLSQFYCVEFFAEKKEYAIKNHDKQGGFNLKSLVPLLRFENSLVFCQAFNVFDSAYNFHAFECHLL